jgi:hypothetical protein
MVAQRRIRPRIVDDTISEGDKLVVYWTITRDTSRGISRRAAD